MSSLYCWATRHCWQHKMLNMSEWKRNNEFSLALLSGYWIFRTVLNLSTILRSQQPFGLETSGCTGIFCRGQQYKLYLCPYAKCPNVLSHFNLILISQQTLIKVRRIKFHENPSTDNRDTRGRIHMTKITFFFCEYMRIGLKLTPTIKLDSKITSSGNGALHVTKLCQGGIPLPPCVNLPLT
jgi:hypothetical protein